MMARHLNPGPKGYRELSTNLSKKKRIKKIERVVEQEVNKNKIKCGWVTRTQKAI